MAGPSWIRGKSLDSRERLDIETHPKFHGYLVHLKAPACTMVVGERGLSEEVKIPHDANAGYYYQNASSGIELVILQWHGRPLEDAGQISGLLYEAASELLCEQMELYADTLVEIQD
jgi:hypothetical protein